VDLLSHSLLHFISMHKDELSSKRKHPEVPPQPSILPGVSPGGILELLLVQKKRGEELLKSDFLSIENVSYWNLFTKEILTKAFGTQPECVFRTIPATDSDGFRPPVPIHSGRAFRLIPATHSGAFRPPLRGLNDAG
jgi:hypothetical protein